VLRRLAQIIALTRQADPQLLNRAIWADARHDGLTGVDILDWHRIEEAPFDEDVELFVTDRCGSYYPLREACRRTSQGWVSSVTGAPLDVTPVMWKPHDPLTQSRD
jgi:hypothetical protein